MSIIGIILIFFILMYHILNIYQQEHYDFIKLLSTYKKLYTKKIYVYFLYLLFILSFFNSIIINILIFIVGIILFIFRPKYIIKLKFTGRIIRLTITTVLIYILLLIFNYSNTNFIFLVLIFPFNLYIINAVNYPIEYMINCYYIHKAKKKLQKNKNLIKIAITGSYGKTTIKNILNSILCKKYICLKTPKSYNTILGISKTINEKLTNLTEVLIVEMGANHKNEINKMKKLIDPDISIISEVGPQHLSTFKTITNVFKTKLEVINFNKPDSITIVNNDNIYLKHLEIPNKKLFKVGINKNKYIYATNIKVNQNITTFNIIDNVYKEKHKISTNLLGEHNINNILIAYLTSKLLNVDSNILIESIEALTPVSNRLSYKKVNNIHIYDDSYNSNIKGFINAINVLKSTNTKKIIITPGIVDAGTQEEKINTEIAKIINESNIDEIYLIKNKATIYYEKVLSNYKIYNNFIDAYNHIQSTYTLEEVSLLIENDLPDNYFER